MTTLDEIVFKSALARARRYMRNGCVAEQAAEQACVGAWELYLKRVLNALMDEQKRSDPA